MASRNLGPWSGGRMAGFEPLFDLHREMNRMFDDVFRGGTLADVRGGGGFMTTPRVDVRESNGELCVMAELPGVTQQELDLQLDGDVLTISGEHKQEHEEEKANYYLMERSHGRFQRSLQLPFAPDPEQVKANFENGVLTIRMPNQGQGARTRRIQISGESASGSPSTRSASPEQSMQKGQQGQKGQQASAGGSASSSSKS